VDKIASGQAPDGLSGLSLTAEWVRDNYAPDP